MNTQSEVNKEAEAWVLSQEELAVVAEQIIADIKAFQRLLNNRPDGKLTNRAWSDAAYAVEFMGSSKVELSR